MPVRVRFAPSPTGPFSLGNARTAIFAWLFAKKEGGKFLIRIEDTDKERSKKEYEEGILKTLEWLGIVSDEPVVRQSERSAVYESHLKKLLEERKAYYCFCTPEELEAERQAQLSQGFPPRYSGKCKSLSPDVAAEKVKKGEGVIRFKMPETTISFQDAVHGKASFDASLIGDIIIAKSLRGPLYNFAVVVDDYEMKVTHVIRGDDHFSNTPKQIAIQDALGLPHVHYAHLPLILGPDHKKLSKRYLDASMYEYKTAGYLASAVFNFLALLGWHPEKDREVLTVREILEEFSLKRVQKSGGIFNPEKLEWLNAQHIKNTPDETLAELLEPFVPSVWHKKKELLQGVIHIEKERVKHLSDFQDLAGFFFELPEYEKELLVWNDTPLAAILDNLGFALNVIQEVPPHEFKKHTIEQYLGAITEKRGRGEVLWPLRVALSGKEASPGPAEIMEALGKEESVRRIKIAIGKMES